MPGLASVALGTAPIFGGVLLGVMAGNLRAPDVRGSIKQDLDLLDRIPEDQTERRAELQRSIDSRIDDLIAVEDRRRSVRDAVVSYEGNWRDIVLFVCAMLFTYVWWHVSHQRADWLAVFIVMILASVLTAGYVLRGLRGSLAQVLRRKRE